jgi:hypothetical protein
MVGAASAQVPDDPLADVKRLYASAFFEEALAALDMVRGQLDPNQIDEYRALCLLGLNRTREAEQALERLISRQRSSRYNVASHSPKFVSLYEVVRKRTLPVVATALYTSARDTYERGEFTTASEQFDDLLELLADAGGDRVLRDIAVLADGFARLTKQRLAEAASQTLPSPAPAAPPIRSATISKAVYGLEDQDVTPPAVVDQRMPAWIPPNPSLAKRVFHGTLEVIVGEDGAVVNRTMSTPTFPSYDWELLRAAERWSYQPATREGRPVKYRKIIAVTLGAEP